MKPLDDVAVGIIFRRFHFPSIFLIFEFFVFGVFGVFEFSSF